MEKSQWYLIYTKSNSEKKVGAFLNKKGILTYCPLMSSVRQWSDRKVTIEIPIFTSYVFVNIDLSQYREVRMTPGVLNFVYWQGKPAIVKDKEMDSIKRFIKEYNHLSFTVTQLKHGNRVTIPSGIFKDQPAIVQTVKKNKVILELVNLQLRLEVKLERD